MDEKLFKFLSEKPCKIFFGDHRWMIVNKDEVVFFFQVFEIPITGKRGKKIYDGHNLSEALWWLEHGK